MKPKCPTSTFEGVRQTRSRLSIYRAKCTPLWPRLLSKNLSEDHWRLNTLGQKQYLAWDVGEKCLMNKLIRIE